MHTEQTPTTETWIQPSRAFVDRQKIRDDAHQTLKDLVAADTFVCGGD